MFVNIRVFFIFISHGINPFAPLKKTKDAIKTRLTASEKDYVIANTKDNYIKGWLRKMICE